MFPTAIGGYSNQVVNYGKRENNVLCDSNRRSDIPRCECISGYTLDQCPVVTFTFFFLIA